MEKEKVLKALKNYDRDVYLSFGYTLEEKLECYIVGGSALILLDLIPRATLDIDILKTIGKMADEFSDLNFLMSKYDININSSAYNDCYSDLNSYSQRAKKLEIETKSIDFYVLSVEDLVAAKLAAGREKDLCDIKQPAVISSINWQTLDSIINEVKEGMLSDSRISFFDIAYKEFKKEFYNEGIDL